MVILRNALAHLAGSETHHGVLVGVVVRCAMKNSHAQRAFLQLCRERVDVGDVGQAARDARQDGVDLRLGELHERQHLGAQLRRVASDPVRRNGDAAARIAGGGGQPRDRGCGEERAHVDAPPGLRQALDHAHDEQRMAAELEEIVAASDSLEPQGLREDAGDQLFALALRRLEGARSVGAGAGRGQGFTIQLAVRRERQSFETNVCGGDHVGRQ